MRRRRLWRSKIGWMTSQVCRWPRSTRACGEAGGGGARGQRFAPTGDWGSKRRLSFACDKGARSGRHGEVANARGASNQVPLSVVAPSPQQHRPPVVCRAAGDAIGCGNCSYLRELWCHVGWLMYGPRCAPGSTGHAESASDAPIGRQRPVARRRRRCRVLRQFGASIVAASAFWRRPA